MLARERAALVALSALTVAALGGRVGYPLDDDDDDDDGRDDDAKEGGGALHHSRFTPRRPHSSVKANSAAADAPCDQST